MDSLTMDNVEQLTLAELRELQTKRLKQTLTFVYENSPVYQKKFDDAGVHPDDFVTLDDLAKFPFAHTYLQVVAQPLYYGRYQSALQELLYLNTL